MCLMNADRDGRVVLERRVNDGEDWVFKFIMLNPAQRFSELVDEARAVVLLGGTMQPFSYVASQLLPHASLHTSAAAAGAGIVAGPMAGPRVVTFACGHVIPPTSVLPLALTKGPTGVAMDFTFRTRGSHEMVRLGIHRARLSVVCAALRLTCSWLRQMDELGRVVFNCCAAVPHGVVVFLPSYDYERLVVERWTQTGCLARLRAKKKVFREPRRWVGSPQALSVGMPVGSQPDGCQ